MKLAAVVLGLLMLLMTLAGCGTAAETGADSTGSSQAVTETAAETDADTGAESSQDEMFTDRDMDPSYDESEATKITLSGSSASADGNGVSVSGSTVTISEEGVYILSGKLTGQVIVEAEETAKVQIVLDGAEITNSGSAAIYVKQADKVFLTLADGSENTLSTSGTYAADGDTNVDAVVFSKEDLCIQGGGTLAITSEEGNGVTSKDDLKVTGGTISIDVTGHALEGKDSVRIADGSFDLTCGKDGIHADNDEDDTKGYVYIAGGTFKINASDDGIHAVTTLTINAGTFDITAAEALEATYITINDGVIGISASDDGINASAKSTAYTPTIEINGGKITISMGQGDTDAVDSNGYIYINGGEIDITAQSPFDYDMGAELNGGTLIVNGAQTTEITNQMMGGGMPGGEMGGQGGGQMPGAPGGMQP
ncbi:MAG: carbohydrate-binding domain-containing protein [Clostridiales bacterium]|nr:carbohydrate-binding domain-containing protein [Clostridiales bacterium]